MPCEPSVADGNRSLGSLQYTAGLSCASCCAISSARTLGPDRNSTSELHSSSCSNPQSYTDDKQTGSLVLCRWCHTAGLPRRIAKAQGEDNSERLVVARRHGIAARRDASVVLGPRFENKQQGPDRWVVLLGSTSKFEKQQPRAF